jgi:predicted esterase
VNVVAVRRSLWLLVALVGAGAAAAHAQGDQRPADTAALVVRHIVPSSIDTSVRRFNAPHLVVFDRAVKADAPLLLFLPGTGGRPDNTSEFAAVAARQGYRVIGLAYVDEPAVQQVCPREPDPECAEKVRRKRIYGDDVTGLIDDRPNESIVSRLAMLLAALERAYPDEGWSRYLENGKPEWTRIAVSGLSQGAGMAAYIAQRTMVDRVVLFSSPWDNYGRMRNLAPWLRHGHGATSPERWYAAYHRNENTADDIQRAYAALQIPRDHIHVFTLEPARRVSANPFHPSVVGNAATPRNADGTPAYAPEWRAMLGEVHP